MSEFEVKHVDPSISPAVMLTPEIAKDIFAARSEAPQIEVLGKEYPNLPWVSYALAAFRGGTMGDIKTTDYIVGLQAFLHARNRQTGITQPITLTDAATDLTAYLSEGDKQRAHLAELKRMRHAIAESYKKKRGNKLQNIKIENHKNFPRIAQAVRRRTDALVMEFGEEQPYLVDALDQHNYFLFTPDSERPGRYSSVLGMIDAHNLFKLQENKKNEELFGEQIGRFKDFMKGSKSHFYVSEKSA